MPSLPWLHGCIHRCARCSTRRPWPVRTLRACPKHTKIQQCRGERKLRRLRSLRAVPHVFVTMLKWFYNYWKAYLKPAETLVLKIDYKILLTRRGDWWLWCERFYLVATCLPIMSMLARRRCMLADLLLRASSRNDATALRSRSFTSLCSDGRWEGHPRQGK